MKYLPVYSVSFITASVLLPHFERFNPFLENTLLFRKDKWNTIIILGGLGENNRREGTNFKITEPLCCYFEMLLALKQPFWKLRKGKVQRLQMCLSLVPWCPPPPPHWHYQYGSCYGGFPEEPKKLLPGTVRIQASNTRGAAGPALASCAGGGLGAVGAACLAGLDRESISAEQAASPLSCTQEPRTVPHSILVA